MHTNIAPLMVPMIQRSCSYKKGGAMEVPEEVPDSVSYAVLLDVLYPRCRYTSGERMKYISELICDLRILLELAKQVEWSKKTWL